MFAKNENVTVKILFIQKGEEFSLQKHQNRSEFWRVLAGNPEITLGSEKVTAKAGDEFEILPNTAHHIRALDNDAEVLEVSRGDFDENDIERIEDKYGRS